MSENKEHVSSGLISDKKLTEQNNEMLRGLVKELDKLKGVVKSKIKRGGNAHSGSKRKIAKCLKM
jgi:hypothetical protein